MTNDFFPKTCEWIYPDKKGNLVQCTQKWSDIYEPELSVYCAPHYEMILKPKEK